MLIMNNTLVAPLARLQTVFVIFCSASANEASFFAFDLHENSRLRFQVSGFCEFRVNIIGIAIVFSCIL